MMSVMAILRQLFHSMPPRVNERPLSSIERMMFTFSLCTLFLTALAYLCNATLEVHRSVVNGRYHNLSFAIGESVFLVSDEPH
jgi:hypothetical protein